MLLLLSVLGLLQLADGLMTHFFVSQGLARELNPLVTGIAGDVAFPSLKLAGAFACIGLLWLVARRYRALAAGVTVAAVMFYAVIVGWNIHVLIVG